MWETPEVSFIFQSQTNAGSGYDETRTLNQVIYNFTHLCTGHFSKFSASKFGFLAEENRLNIKDLAATSPRTAFHNKALPHFYPKTLGGCLIQMRAVFTVSSVIRTL